MYLPRMQRCMVAEPLPDVLLKCRLLQHAARHNAGAHLQERLQCLRICQSLHIAGAKAEQRERLNLLLAACVQAEREKRQQGALLS